MAIYENLISLDLSAKDNYKHISAKQGDYDSRYLRITITSDGALFKLVESDVVALRCEHEDNTFDMNVGTVNDDGTVSVKIPKSILSRIGSASCDVSITRENGGLISTSSFVLSIEKSSLTGNIDTGDSIKQPSELFAEISANTDARHKHNDNLEVLDKISESDSGAFLYNGEEIKQTADNELSESSENAIQNKVVASKFNAVEEDISYLEKSAEEMQTGLEESQTVISNLENNLAGVSETAQQNSSTIETLEAKQNEMDERLVAAEEKSHEHENKDVLDNFSFANSRPSYNGNTIPFSADIPSPLSGTDISNILNGGSVLGARYLGKEQLASFRKEILKLRTQYCAFDGNSFEQAIIYNNTVGETTPSIDIFVNSDFFDLSDKIIFDVVLHYDNETYSVRKLKSEPDLINTDANLQIYSRPIESAYTGFYTVCVFSEVSLTDSGIYNDIHDGIPEKCQGITLYYYGG